MPAGRREAERHLARPAHIPECAPRFSRRTATDRRLQGRWGGVRVQRSDQWIWGGRMAANSGRPLASPRPSRPMRRPGSQAACVTSPTASSQILARRNILKGLEGSTTPQVMYTSLLSRRALNFAGRAGGLLGAK
jgi:hypothetical protein